MRNSLISNRGLFLFAVFAILGLVLATPLLYGKAEPTGLSNPKISNDLRRQLENESEKTRIGVMLHFSKYPDPEQIMELEDLGVEMELRSWIPETSDYTGFLYARLHPGAIPALADLSYVERLTDGESLATQRSDLKSMMSEKERLNPYKHPLINSILLQLNAVARERSLEHAETWATVRGLDISEGRVKVTITSDSETSLPIDKIEAAGGIIIRTWSTQLSAWMPINDLLAIADALDDRYYISRPAKPGLDETVGEAIAATGVNNYHTSGWDGTGVTIGLIDTEYDDWTDAEDEGDVPPAASFVPLYAGQVFQVAADGNHGTNCAEMLFDLAPNATYRIYRAEDPADLVPIVNLGIADGVMIFSHSLSFYNRGWHDNSGNACEAANLASDNGILFITSAGNRAQSHWQGNFQDGSVTNDIHEWGAGDEFNRIDQNIQQDEGFIIYLQWEGANDYNLFLHRADGGPRFVSSINYGVDNFQAIGFTHTFPIPENYWFSVEHVSGPGGRIEIFVTSPFGFDIEYSTPDNSTTSPSNSHGANVIPVAASDVGTFTWANPAIADYSSRGPTNDDLQVPNITGPTEVTTHTESQEWWNDNFFGGTSCAAPCVAGAAAAEWSRLIASAVVPAPNAASVRHYLFNRAQANRDWGANGVDNTFGHGGVNVDGDITFAGPADAVFVVDVTGSTAGRRDFYKQQIRALADEFEENHIDSRFALLYHMDFPYGSFGDPNPPWNDVAYAVETDFVDTPDDLQPFIDALPDGNGIDHPESQYTAYFQAVVGNGVDLNRDDGYADLDGDVVPAPLTYNPDHVRLYHVFTTPWQLHNSDSETDYPRDHATHPGAQISCSQDATEAEYSGLENTGMLFGYEIIEKSGNRDNQGQPVASGEEINLRTNWSKVLEDPPENDLERLAWLSGGRTFTFDGSPESFEAVADTVFNWAADSLQLRPMTITIEKVHDVLQGHYISVSITTEYRELEMGGFDLLIAYDASALAPTEVTPGQLLEDCGWEYFTYRYGVHGNCGDACPSGLLRIMALAETNNGPYHPSCYGPPDIDPHELAEITFYVTNDRTFNCQFTPIYFFWDDCNDNSISNIDGSILYIDHAIYDFEGNLIWHEEDDDEFPEDARIPFVGAPDYCLNPDPEKPSAVRRIDFVNGGIDIICSDSIDLRGDINCNGIPNEIADAVMFANFFIIGFEAFGDHVEASIAASDVNADGIPLSVADLVYLARVLTGDAQPHPKALPYAIKASVDVMVNHSAAGVSATSVTDIGAGYFVLEHSGLKIGKPQLINGVPEMTLKYSNESGVLKVLVYSMEKGVRIPAGTESIFAVPISGEGNIELVETQLSDYYGNLLEVTISKRAALPKTFALHQNYPNPFNATTTIISTNSPNRSTSELMFSIFWAKR
jgi:hypothetical protein